MRWIHHVPQRIEQHLCASLDAPHGDLPDPLRVGGLAGYVVGQGVVDLVGHRGHQAG